VPQSLAELRDIINVAVMIVDEDKLRRVPECSAFRWDVCQNTCGSHIEYLRKIILKWAAVGEQFVLQYVT
jgi:hypothetical protein